MTGKVWRNLVVIDGAPSDYQRYANEWVYTYAAEAGQDIRILDLDAHPAADVSLRAGDFWVVEHRHVALVRYDDGTPFTQWFAAHSQHLRRNRAA